MEKRLLEGFVWSVDPFGWSLQTIVGWRASHFFLEETAEMKWFGIPKPECDLFHAVVRKLKIPPRMDDQLLLDNGPGCHTHDLFHHLIQIFR